MASWPTAIKNFVARVAGDTIQPAHINDLQDEVTAIQTQLFNWAAYTPALAELSIGNGTLTGRYFLAGKFCAFRVGIIFGATTGMTGGNVDIGLPFESAVPSGAPVLAVGSVSDASSGQYWDLRAVYINAGAVRPLHGDGAAASPITNISPFTWAVNDELHLSGFYEIA